MGFFRLIAIAAVLGHEPIFAQPLRFVHGLAGAVEQLAVQGSISIMNFRHTVRVPEFRVAFFAGHQIKLFHSCIVLSVSRVRHTTCSFYHERPADAIDACVKKHPGFAEEVCIDTTSKRSAGTRSLHPPNAERKGFGRSPTSILNLILKKSDSKIADWYQPALLAKEAQAVFREY
ncbi:hypothetical protein [Faecalibacterium wellingii]|uniref:Secreted protein n=1 Tax=Faecalibacterium wellingii TaxID=2929491 RepID=A0ABU3TXE5_9FIRM|nr:MULTISPECIES: hypothetical protein [Faecalibacterium]MDU8687971.1 hypothetical protein [Faecalibacterium prausnitzii]UQK55919.1 hypothetical protein MTP37_09775 [Faecalibacterium sp. HTF-F]